MGVVKVDHVLQGSNGARDELAHVVSKVDLEVILKHDRLIVRVEIVVESRQVCRILDIRTEGLDLGNRRIHSDTTCAMPSVLIDGKVWSTPATHLISGGLPDSVSLKKPSRGTPIFMPWNVAYGAIVY